MRLYPLAGTCRPAPPCTLSATSRDIGGNCTRERAGGVAKPLAGGTGTAVADGESYYTHTRPEVVRLIPESARQIVDVGCGAGALGASIKRALPNVQVRGVEVVHSQAERAKSILDDAVTADA